MIKRNFALLFVLFIIPVIIIAGKPKYNIKVKIAGIKDTVCYLGNYYGDKQYIKDTAKVDSKGNFEFSGDEVLPGGIYLIITPAKKYFEVIVDKEQNFSLETDTNNFIGKMKVKGSEDNQLFYDYLKFINSKQKEVAPLRDLANKIKDNKDSAKLLQDQLNEIDKEVKDYKMTYINNHPLTFLSQVFKSSYDPVPPEAPILSNGRKDSTFAYKYFKSHYFDNLDFSDDRLLRTPVYHNKINYYINTLVVQHPDSLIKEADSIIERARANKEVFKYTVWYLTNWSETSNIMGFDAIFVHLVEKYYMTNQAFWVTPTNLDKITSRAKILKGLLLGTKVPNLTAPDTSGVFQTLYNISAKYTVLYFWDPTCGHCQKETPKLKALYDSIKTKSFEVYAFNTDPNVDHWKKYIITNKLNWINVMDAQNTTGFHTTFDIFSTPVLFLLDENKKILAKRLNVEQLKEFLTMQFKKDEKIKEKTN